MSARLVSHAGPDDEVRPRLRAAAFWLGLLGSLAIWTILATVCLRLFD